MGHEIQADDLAVRLHGFFVAFALVVACDAVAHQVSNQLEDGALALLRLGQLLDHLHHRALGGAHETLEEHLVAGGAPNVARPDQLLNGRQPCEIRLHCMLQISGYLFGTCSALLRSAWHGLPRGQAFYVGQQTRCTLFEPAGRVSACWGLVISRRAAS